MIWRAAIATVAVLALAVATSSPAVAWDPLREPAAPTPPPADPAPFVAPPPGIYYVTDTYVADVVTTDGASTTYTTSTVHESTGSYARVLDVVATGVASPYDGSAFNGRRTLSDGRLIAGTYYENYVWTLDGFVPVSIVFFQDDAEWLRLSAPTPTPVRPVPPSPTPTRSPAVVCCGAAQPPTSVPQATPTPRRPIRPTLTLLPAGAPLARVEVLRGRQVAIWAHAFVDDRELPVRGWRVVSGDTGDASVSSGRGGSPFVASWSRLAPPGIAYELVLRLEIDTPETGPRTVDATIAVVVRAPALEPLE